MFLRVELEKEVKKKLSFKKSSKVLDGIINSQRSPHDKSGIGYTHMQKENVNFKEDSDSSSERTYKIGSPDFRSFMTLNNHNKRYNK